jgi:transposase InsO family protein
VTFTAIADWASDGEYTVAFMCAELGVSRSGFYAWQARAGAPPGPRASYDERLTQLLISLFTYLKGNPGVRRLHADLRALGHRVSRKRVHRLMKAAGLRGRAPKAWRPTTTTTAAGPAPAPDLIGRRFTAEAPNQAWCGDITYIKTWQGWAYLATVIDLHSRALVGWAIADHARTDLVTDALEMAIQARRPAPGVVFHSDRGCQYTSRQFVDFCRRRGIRRSVGRTGSCFDNAVSESFNATYKKELIHTRPWPALDELIVQSRVWFDYYNKKRRHSTIHYLTPAEKDLGYSTLDQIAALNNAA